MRKYAVYLGEKRIGTMELYREKLYYKFICRCNFPTEDQYWICAQGENGAVSLGVCVPVDGCFGFRTSIPIKKIGEGELKFTAHRRHSPQVSEEIHTDRPFMSIEMIRSGKLEIENGLKKIVFQNYSCSVRPMGQ